MKNNWPVAIIVFFIALFIYIKLVGPIPFFINSVNTTKTDLFSTSGEGKVAAVPDQATVNVGVTSQAATVITATDQVNQNVKNVIQDIKKLGLSDKDIKTTNYSITPNYSYEVLPMARDQQAITGYSVTQNLEIKVKPIDKLNKVIDTATVKGANLVGNISFTFSESLQKSLESKATQGAVAEAKSKAQNLAKAAGIRLGSIVNVVQSSDQPRPLLSAGVAEKTDQAPTNITPGENTITVNVTLYYAIY